jgi:hypothetical protein
MSLIGKLQVGEDKAEASFMRCSRFLNMLASLATAMIFLKETFLEIHQSLLVITYSCSYSAEICNMGCSTQ